VNRQAPAAARADKWISRAAGATVAGLAGIGGAISYSHMRQFAAAHGDPGWHAHASPCPSTESRSSLPWSCSPTRRKRPALRIAAVGRPDHRHRSQPGR
jgi:hypothetical protein